MELQEAIAVAKQFIRGTHVGDCLWMLADYAESFSDRERLARIDERKKCAEKALKWNTDMTTDATIDSLFAAIMEDGK